MWRRKYRLLEGEPAAEGAAPAAEAEAAPAPEAEGGSPPEPERPVRPEHVPEKFWDADKGEVRLDALIKSQQDAEKTVSKRIEELMPEARKAVENEFFKDRPEKPDDYQLPAVELEGVGEVPLDADDPLLTWFKEYAHAAGMGQEKFNEAVEQYVRSQITTNPVEEMKKLGENAEARVQRIQLQINKVLSPDQAAALAMATTTAVGVEALEALMDKMKQASPEDFDGDTDVNEPLTRKELELMMQDPRYRDPLQRDEKYIAKVRAGFKKLVETEGKG